MKRMNLVLAGIALLVVGAVGAAMPLAAQVDGLTTVSADSAEQVFGGYGCPTEPNYWDNMMGCSGHACGALMQFCEAAHNLKSEPNPDLRIEDFKYRAQGCEDRPDESPGTCCECGYECGYGFYYDIVQCS